MNLMPLADNIQLITLFIVLLSGYNVLRQKLTSYDYVRNILVAVHVFFAGILVFELIRVIDNSTLFMDIYTIANTTFVLIDVALLTLVAFTVYYRPSGAGSKGMFTEMMKSHIHGPVFLAFIGYIVFADIYLIIFRPFSIRQYISIVGTTISNTNFNTNYLALLFIVLIIFILYPSVLLVDASRRVKSKRVSRALILLPAVWSLIGLELLFFNGFLLNGNYDVSPLGYLIAALCFGLTGMIFRRASLLADVFEPLQSKVAIQPQYSFSRRLGNISSIEGKVSLLEVDPDYQYEELIKEFSNESVSLGKSVYVFTSKGSRVYNALYSSQGIGFYIFSTRVSYPKRVEQSQEILVPQNDQAVLLDVIEKTIDLSPERNIAIVLDSITDMIVYWGYDTCYKFIKEANSILSNPKVTAFFIIL
ncbi:MAG: hypothetical protein QXV84_04535, partial [Conexivisphaerales archaeon]